MGCRIFVGHLAYAGGSFFAVGVRREHLLYDRGLFAFRQLDQFVQSVGHSVGAESVLHAELESVFVGGIFLFLRELRVGEGRYQIAQL